MGMSIQEALDKIENAVHGREVRQAIHDGIEDCYLDGKAGSTDLVAREQIAAETSARQQADTALNNALNTETSTREQADTGLNTRLTGAESSIGDHGTRLTAAEGAITDLQTDKVDRADVLDFEECVAATEPGYVADALAVKELNSNLTGLIKTIRSGGITDANGNLNCTLSCTDGIPLGVLFDDGSLQTSYKFMQSSGMWFMVLTDNTSSYTPKSNFNIGSVTIYYIEI